MISLQGIALLSLFYKEGLLIEKERKLLYLMIKLSVKKEFTDLEMLWSSLSLEKR